MVDAVYRGNIEELFSVLNHLKKYIVIFVFVLLVLISILHFSKYSVQVLPLITVTVVLFSAVYYTTVLVLKFVNGITSNQTSEVTTMNTNNQQALKTPDLSYPKSPTPPPSYEEATRNDIHYQPRPWLPSTSSGFSGTATPSTPVFNVEYQYNASVSNNNNEVPSTTIRNQSNEDCVPKKTIQNIPSVTITLDGDQHPI